MKALALLLAAAIAYSTGGDAQAETGKSTAPTTYNIDAMMAYKAKDYGTAYQNFKQSAVENHDAFSMFYTGLLTMQGRGVERNPEAAIEWFEMACERDMELACDAVRNFSQR